MLTVRELKGMLSHIEDENLPVMVPSVVGIDPAGRAESKSVYFRGSFEEPGQWVEEGEATTEEKARGALRAVVIS